ncbi:response regulator [Cohnella sp. GCM10012308]|uniref:response regulator n=1 Tax=Cohnella sp. GCM10012308 TaxID=3317329 RepID=UPI003615863E
MLKVVVADDEKIQREGIARHIPWQELQLELAGCAKDGREALALMELQGADILITDIRMPGMGGLELCASARELYPELQIMIISGYDEFEYARAAIELNAYSFMLKPINIRQLAEKLGKLAIQLEQHRRSEADLAAMHRQLEESRPLLLDKFAKDLLFGRLRHEDTIANRAQTLSFSIPESGCSVVLIQLEDIPKEDVSRTAHQLLMLELQRDLSELLAPGNRGMAFLSGEDELIALLFHESPDEQALSLQLEALRTCLHSRFPRRATISASGVKRTFAELEDGYREAEAASRQKFYLGKGSTIRYADFDADTLPPASLAGAVERLMADVGTGQQARIAEQLDEILRHIPYSAGIGAHALRSFGFQIVSDIYKQAFAMNVQIDAVFGENALLWESVAAFDTVPEAREWLTEALTTLATHVYGKRSRKHADVVDTILDVLDNRYGEPITIEELAKKVFLTPNYICNIFKENVGESIIDYLTKVRMKQAKALLIGTRCKIYEVAEQTGFNNTSYFSSVFKGMFGVSPKEFREVGYAESGNA